MNVARIRGPSRLLMVQRPLDLSKRVGKPGFAPPLRSMPRALPPPAPRLDGRACPPPVALAPWALHTAAADEPLALLTNPAATAPVNTLPPWSVGVWLLPAAPPEHAWCADVSPSLPQAPPVHLPGSFMDDGDVPGGDAGAWMLPPPLARLARPDEAQGDSAAIGEDDAAASAMSDFAQTVTSPLVTPATAFMCQFG